jgi:ankyrin repeat protein
MEAAQAGDIAAIKDLTAQGANVNAKDNDGDTSLFWASNPACVKTLAAAGTDVNAKNYACCPGGATALIVAATLGETDRVKALIDAGASVTAKDNNGATALHWASNTDCANALIAAGADVNAKDDNGQTPLTYVESDPELAANLRAAGAME